MTLRPDAPTRFEGTLTVEQTRQLLLPINPRRVGQANGHSHVPAHEVIAHLIRVFGFGNFNFEFVDEPTLIFETFRGEGTPTHNGRYDVCYRVAMRLTIFDKDHNVVAWYEDSSTGDAQNQTRAAGHDLALKSAISLAKKRCAIHLGDQFGLSLYNKGSMNAQILKTMVAPKTLLEQMWGTATPGQDDASEGIDQQEGLGIDEVEIAQTPTEEQEAALAHSTGARPRLAPEDTSGNPIEPEKR